MSEKYPLTSRMTWVEWLTLTLICPPDPSGTIAALATVCPAWKFKIETGGVGPPVGHARRNAPGGAAGLPVTVKLAEIASAPAGIPQMPVTAQVRRPPLGKMPP